MRTAPWKDQHRKGTLNIGTSEPPRGRGNWPNSNQDACWRCCLTHQQETSGSSLLWEDLPWEGRRRFTVQVLSRTDPCSQSCCLRGRKCTFTLKTATKLPTGTFLGSLASFPA